MKNLVKQSVGTAALALLGLTVAACGTRIEDHPMTQHAQPFAS
jgi:hypothetical protein